MQVYNNQVVSSPVQLISNLLRCAACKFAALLSGQRVVKVVGVSVSGDRSESEHDSMHGLYKDFSRSKFRVGGVDLTTDTHAFSVGAPLRTFPKKTTFTNTINKEAI